VVAVSLLSYTFALIIIDRVFYYFGYLQYLMFKFYSAKLTIDVIELYLENNKFLNSLVSDNQDEFKITENTKFVWLIYNLEVISHNTERIHDSIINKIIHIFQNGVSTFNAVDMSSMLKSMAVDSITHYEEFIEKQLNQQFTQIVDIISRTNELS
jgi:hypothetical protein